MNELQDGWRLDYQPQLVSVIIPTYNRAAVVADAVRSALAQSWPHCEVIVVNDGSTDSTREVLAELSGITVIEQSNQGVAAARNAGLLAARGEFIANLDSDDVWYPDFLSTLLTAMRRHDCPVGIAAREENVEGSKQALRSTPMERRYINVGQACVELTPAQLRHLALASGIAPNPGVVFHRSVVEPWPIYLRTNDDTGQHARIILRHAPRAVFLTSPLWQVAPKGQDVTSISGRNDRCDLGWRIADGLKAIESEAGALITPAEKRAFARKRADWIVEDTAYPLAVRGQIKSALEAYLAALFIDGRPVRFWQMLHGLLRSMRSALAGSSKAKY